ncbi:MAG: hypothetical protein K2X38_17335 [Gemmataceae bacterium]|nr:hypothetical protein [Gemmataceae bacterium]
MSGNKSDELSERLRCVRPQSPPTGRFDCVRCVFDSEITEPISDGAFDDVAATDSFTSGYVWNDREQEADGEMLYHRARCFDPNPGSWLDQD